MSLLKKVSPSLLLVVALAACGGSSPPADRAAQQVVWKNGASGSWFGDTPSIEPTLWGSRYATVAAADPISGDTAALQVGSFMLEIAGGGGIRLVTLAPHDAGAYAGGHLQFNIRPDVIGISAIEVGVAYLPNAPNPVDAYTTVSAASLPVGSFSPLSVPISAFGVGPMLARIIVPFQVRVSTSAPLSGEVQVFTISDVRWTAD